MCGIYGFQVKQGEELTPYETTIMSLTLARDMESRGRDSFGGVVIPPMDAEEKKCKLFCGLGKVSEAGTGILKAASGARTFLGHTRTATVGAVKYENCHPFMIGKVIGVHNGSIYNWDQLNRKYERTFEVDSQQIFAHINEDRELKDIEGYGTFFWTRADDNWSKIYLGRTSGGQITVAHLYRDKGAGLNDPNYCAVIWASEYSTVKKVADLLGFGYHTIFIPESKLFYIANAVVYDAEVPFTLGGRSAAGYKRGGYPGGYEEYANYQFDSDYTDNAVDLQGRLGIKAKQSEDDSVKDLSRKARKALKKRKDAWRNKNRAYAEDPLPANIHKGVGFRRYHVPDGQGGAEPVFLCQHCDCELRIHIWGWCPNDKSAKCKAKPNEGCSNLGMVSICADCGHYLLAGIHEEEHTFGIVHCVECNEYCAPEGMLVDDTEVDEIEEAELVGPDDKPTNIVLSESLGHTFEDLVAEAKAIEDGIAKDKEAA